MDNKRYRQIKIPIWVIFLVLIFSPPLAAILFVIRLIKIPIPNSSEKSAEKKEEKAASSSDVTSPGKTVEHGEKKEDGKKKSVFSGITAGEIVALVLTVLFAAAAVGAASTFSSPPLIAEVIRLLSYISVSAASFGANCFLRGRRKRTARYKEWIGDKDVFDLRTLSYASGIKERKVVRDMRRMTESGSFGPGAFVDEAEKKFFRSAEAAEKFKKDRDRFGGGPLSSDEIEEYTGILIKIRQLNDSIADPAVSEKISKIEEQTRYIFGYISDHPQKRGNISRFMNYYLPTTLKLLESYATLEKMGEGGENMQKSKEGIEGILSMLSDGFVRQTDQLFASESIDISSEIEVLETMMKKDGLTGERDFGFGGAAAQESEKEAGDK